MVRRLRAFCLAVRSDWILEGIGEAPLRRLRVSRETIAKPMALARRSAALYPWGFPYLCIGRCWLAVGKPELAINVLKKSLAFTDDGAGSSSYFYMGQAYSQMGRNAEAAQAFEQGLKRSDDVLARLGHWLLYRCIPREKARIHSCLGWAYIGMNEYSKAGVEFERSLQILPGYEQAVKGLNAIKAWECVKAGKGKEALGAWKDAAKAYRKAVDTYYWYPRAHRLLSGAHMVLREFREAKVAYEGLRRVRATEPGPYAKVAYAAGMKGDWRCARRNMRKALRMAQDWHPYREALSDIDRHLRAGQTPAGRRALAYVKIARNKERKSQWEEAAHLYRRAVECEPSNQYYLIDLGDAYFRLALYGKAIRAYQEARRIRPSDARTYLAEASAAVALGALKKARKCLRKALRIDAGYEDAEDFLRYLQSLRVKKPQLGRDRPQETQQNSDGG